jgi:DNA-binding SARP family transcriptional activator/TolB-like protein/Tfp pilus assembly protein PilF
LATENVREDWAGFRPAGKSAELQADRLCAAPRIANYAMNGTVPTESIGGVEVAGGARPKDHAIVRIHLLGPMQATTYLGSNILPHGSRARALLGYLCLAAGVHVSRATLSGLLWDRVSERSARANLRQALRELSSTFGKLSHELIISGRDILRLNIDLCWIDALAVLELEPANVSAPDRDLKALCRGELLAGLDGVSASFDRWLLSERTRIAERLELLLRGELERSGRKSRAAQDLNRMLTEIHERLEVLRAAARRSGGAQRKESLHPKQEFDAVDRNNHLTTVPPAGQLADQGPLAGRDRLRVGVLPFLAHGSERDEGDLAFSLSQEIAAGLARFRWFDVIAPIALQPTPSIRFIDEHQLRVRGLDYAVDGSILSDGTKIRISVRLMDLSEHVRPAWSESFELARDELHRLDELVITRIVSRIDPVIIFIEGRPKRRAHYGATGLLLLAMPMVFSMERTKYEKAGELISRAIEIDPDNSMAAAWMAHWHLFYVGQGWAKDNEQALATVREHALRAIQLDPDNAEALGIYAHCCAYGDKDFDTALHCFDQALRLNPSLAFIWAFSALTYCYIGEPKMALQRLERYRELAPTHSYTSYFENVFTIAYTFSGDYERAIMVGRRVVKANPNFVAGYKPLIASLGHLGQRDEAKLYIAKLLALEPDFTVESFGRHYPLKKVSDRRRYMKGLLLAGVPAR